MTTLYITGAGVSADSGIPTFRGNDGYWTIGSRNYTPQEMATRAMYLNDPAQFLLWYYKRFAAYRHVKPNAVHHWLAAKCNDAGVAGAALSASGASGGAARLITQNIDGLDAKADHADYISIHGRLHMMTVLHDQAIWDNDPAAAQDAVPLIAAPWDEVAKLADSSGGEADDTVLKRALREICRIPAAGPEMGVSLKPYVLLFDEYYTELYRMREAEKWMYDASRMVFMGTSFSVNITAIALRVAVQRGIAIEIVDPAPIDLEASFGIPAGMAEITYSRMTAQEWVEKG